MTRDPKVERRRRRVFVVRDRRRPPWRRWFPAIVAILLALCAPLFAYAQSNPDSVVLAWTSTGDDGMSGTAATAEMRLSTSPITLANWSLAAVVPGIPPPGPSGSSDSVVVRGLTYGMTYFFALRVADEAGNWSSLSNQVAWTWNLDSNAPAPPSGVAASRVGGGVHLAWSANGEPDLAGYNVYRNSGGSSPFVRANDSLLTTPGFDDANLPGGAKEVGYRIVALDWSGNQSAPSATASILVSGATVAMEPVYPNPSPLASPVRIPVLVSAPSPGARIDVLDSGGRRVRKLDLSALGPGRTEVVWDGRNDAGRLVAPGVYSAILAGDGLAQRVRLVRVP